MTPTKEALVVRPASSAGDLARRELEAVLADIASKPWPDDIAAARALYDEMGPPIAADIGREDLVVGGNPARMLTPPTFDGDRVVLFLHGGGYVYGSLASHAGLAAEVARACRCRVLQLDYRLAPEHPYPAAVEDACAAYEWLLVRGHTPGKITIVGDSAGGGLVVCTLVRLKSMGRPMPGAAVCISPWTDLEATGESYRSRKVLDPMVDAELALRLAQLYLKGADARLPTASPLHANLQGLPPLLIQVGENEVLFSDAQLLAGRARAAGVDVVFEEWKDMVHVWHLYYPILTAGREAIARIGAFARERTAAPETGARP